MTQPKVRAKNIKKPKKQELKAIFSSFSLGFLESSA